MLEYAPMLHVLKLCWHNSPRPKLMKSAVNTYTLNEFICSYKVSIGYKMFTLRKELFLAPFCIAKTSFRNILGQIFGS